MEIEDRLTPKYLAGLFDGEGYLTILRSLKPLTKTTVYSLRIGIVNTHLDLMKSIHRKFGGYLRVYKRHGMHKPVGDWILTANMADRFLKMIHPYVIVKRDRVKLGRGFQFEMRKSRVPGHARDIHSQESLGAAKELMKHINEIGERISDE